MFLFLFVDFSDQMQRLPDRTDCRPCVCMCPPPAPAVVCPARACPACPAPFDSSKTELQFGPQLSEDSPEESQRDACSPWCFRSTVFLSLLVLVEAIVIIILVTRTRSLRESIATNILPPSYPPSSTATVDPHLKSDAFISVAEKI